MHVRGVCFWKYGFYVLVVPAIRLGDRDLGFEVVVKMFQLAV